MSLEFLNEQIAIIDNRLGELLPSDQISPVELTRAMRYATLAPGKRLRPVLSMASCRAVGADFKEALEAGCAIEILHSFSLIHDDLPAIDNDDLRRGQPTCHIVFGEAIAILAGDALLALAFEVMGKSKAGLAGVLELARAVGVGGVVGGEALDILNENGTPSIEVLREIHQKKTGALFAASCACGAICAGATEPQIESLRAYGFELGEAFQIADDCLNVSSDTETMGKSTGSDEERNKLTYPAVFGLARSRELATDAVARAINHISNLPGDQSELRKIAQFAIERKK